MNRREALQMRPRSSQVVRPRSRTQDRAYSRYVHGRARESTRITIESDSELRFFVSSLANPDRTVIDITDVQADAAFQKALETSSTIQACFQKHASDNIAPIPRGSTNSNRVQNRRRSPCLR